MSLPATHASSPSMFRYRMSVRMSLHGGTPAEGWVSLSLHSEFHMGPETLLERLNNRWRVIPVTRGDGTTLVSRSAIEWVAAGDDVEVSLVGPHAFAVTHEEHAFVALRSGTVLGGTISMEMPEGYNRTSDFINGDDDFFPLRSSEGTLLVNKRCVHDIVLADARGPRAA